MAGEAGRGSSLERVESKLALALGHVQVALGGLMAADGLSFSPN
jgi:hypothetical protein